MSSLKEQAVSSTIWSFAETIGSQGIHFVIGIILARILSPEDYGLIAIIYVFIGFSSVIIDSGFKTSIIRTSNISISETSTIFWYNLLVSFCTSGILYISANNISVFFQKPQLELIIKVFSIVPVINSFGLVQNALMFKSLQFKLNTKITLISNFLSGIIAVVFALNGFEYWSLVVKSILQSLFITSLYWIYNKWKPDLVFNIMAFKKHFKFGNKLLIVGLIDTAFDQIYSLIIGKYYSFNELGYYKRGEGYVELFSKSISRAVQKVNSPILSLIKANNNDIIGPHRKIVSNVTFVVYPLLLGLAAIASPLILILIGEKWMPSVIFLQLLVFSRLSYPIINSGASVFEVLGRSDLNLRYTILNRSLLILVLIFSTRFGIIALILGKIIHSIASGLIIMYMLEKTTSLKIWTQLHDIGRIFIPSLLMALITYLFVYITTPYLEPILVLLLSGLISLISFYLFALVFKLKELDFAIATFIQVYKKIRKNTKSTK
jgi:O-antigen/teichoic acid export membrane protein